MTIAHKTHTPASATGADGLPLRHHEEGVFARSGAMTGAAAGSVAGPPGMVTGAAIGAAVGAVIGTVLDREDDRKRLHDATLDAEIGVEGGDLGAASPDQPPARRGMYSAASAGMGATPTSASEGPLQNPDED
jgi:phage tail tape-measure protein